MFVVDFNASINMVFSIIAVDAALAVAAHRVINSTLLLVLKLSWTDSSDLLKAFALLICPCCQELIKLCTGFLASCMFAVELGCQTCRIRRASFRILHCTGQAKGVKVRDGSCQCSPEEEHLVTCLGGSKPQKWHLYVDPPEAEQFFRLTNILNSSFCIYFIRFVFTVGQFIKNWVISMVAYSLWAWYLKPVCEYDITELTGVGYCSHENSIV